MNLSISEQRINLIISRLNTAFSPTQLIVLDESNEHIGHSGHQGGARHFSITISSSKFKNLARLQAHREIYHLFQDMIPQQIHALRIVIIN